MPDNSILITANMQSEMGFPTSHQLKSYVASKSRLKLAARAVLSADAGLLVAPFTVALDRDSDSKDCYVLVVLFLKIFFNVFFRPPNFRRP